MKRNYILLTFILFLFPLFVKANSIEEIKMDIYVDHNGSAHVTETWNAYLTEGTEGYKPYYNLGSSRISNFKVTLNNQTYTFNDNWNTEASFEAKKYTNGFHYISGGVELCFGISSYGHNIYILTYNISNFVVNTSDGYQMLYWKLFPHDYNPSPKRVYIKIHSDFAYPDTLDVWGFGKGGVPTYVYNGYIEMDSEGTVNSDEYMTILVKFPPSTFSLSASVDSSFEEYLNMANTDAVTYHANDVLSIVTNVISSIVHLIFPIFIFLIIAIPLITKPKYGKYRINFGKEGKKISNNDAPYFRDIPYHKEELSKAYWISCQYGFVKNNTDYLGALLLKWIKMGNIATKKSDKDTQIIFNNDNNLDEDEKKLYQMMVEASNDGVLEKHEFESWCKTNYQKILSWFDKVIDSATISFIDSGMLIQENNRLKCTTTSKMREVACQIYGLKRFLNDFSNIKDRSAIEVNYWEEYLMYAQIFGIAKKVMKEFKNLYPEVITEEVYDNINFIYTVSYNGIRSASSAREKAMSYSSGGGGFSSSGGGGGSFGGGGGGGGFR